LLLREKLRAAEGGPCKSVQVQCARYWNLISLTTL
jgi:hypothetical protein